MLLILSFLIASITLVISPYAKITEELNISVNTVRMHIKNSYAKLQLSSKYELMNVKKDIAQIPGS